MKEDLKKETLAKIKEQKIKVKPKSYFQLLKVLLYGFSVLLVLAAIYVFNLMFYLPGRSVRLLESGRAANLLSLFPWPLLVAGSLIVGLLIYLYRNYEGGYKKRIGLIALLIFGAMLLLGAAVAKSHFNERLEQGTHLRRFYQWNEDNFVPRGPRNKLRIDSVRHR